MLSSLHRKRSGMHRANSIVMNAPEEAVFEVAADLERWPTFLPHYRYIHYYEKNPVCNVVRMAARRGCLPIAWTSEQIIDREHRQIRFRHLKAWTKGMEVLWRFQRVPSGVNVEIVHDLAFRIALLAPLAEPIIGGVFINHIATQTLRHMKAYVEKR
jgi:ribosome-associated toxin RatA of RatAB toxin-antitoxin module